jgi:hypothetical protein
VPVPKPNVSYENPKWWENVYIDPSVAWKDPRPAVVDPAWMDPTDPLAKFQLQAGGDWLTNPATVIEYNGGFVGEHGGVAAAAANSFGRAGVTAGVGVAAGAVDMHFTPNALSGVPINR